MGKLLERVYVLFVTKFVSNTYINNSIKFDITVSF